MSTDSLDVDALVRALDAERKAAGLTLAALGKELGLSEQTVGRYLSRQERDLPIPVLMGTLRVLGLSLKEFVAIAESREERLKKSS